MPNGVMREISGFREMSAFQLQLEMSMVNGGRAVLSKERVYNLLCFFWSKDVFCFLFLIFHSGKFFSKCFPDETYC